METDLSARLLAAEAALGDTLKINKTTDESNLSRRNALNLPVAFALFVYSTVFTTEGKIKLPDHATTKKLRITKESR